MSVFLAIPCYKPKEHHWTALAAYIVELRTKLALPIEFVVVDDGSPFGFFPSDQWGDGFFRNRIVRRPLNEGKGAVLTHAVSLMPQDSTVYAFTDFDCPYSIDDIAVVISYVYQKRADVCIGDRTFNDSYEDNLGLGRLFLHRLLRFFVRTIVIGGVNDTQCGVKAYHADLVRSVVKVSFLKGFLFDLEWIYLTQKAGATLKKVPVVLNENHLASKSRSHLSNGILKEAFAFVKKVISRTYDLSAIQAIMREQKESVLKEVKSKA